MSTNTTRLHPALDVRKVTPLDAASWRAPRGKVLNIRDCPDLLKALAHEDANIANWQGLDPTMWQGVSDATANEEGLT